jgi:hypothetical protein
MTNNSNKKLEDRNKNNTTAMNNLNKKLETNVKKFVDGYLASRNKNNATAMNNLTKNFGMNIRAYVNLKRPKVTGAVIGNLQTTGAPMNVQVAAAEEAERIPLNAKPENAAQQMSQTVTKSGGNPTQAASSAANVAQHQALGQGEKPPVAEQEAVRAAVRSSLQNTSTPEEAAQTASAALMAAGGNAVNANKAAKLAALLSVLNNFNGKNNTWYANQNLNALAAKVNNAAKNVDLNENTRARLNVVRRRINNAKKAKEPPTRANELMKQASQPVANNRKNMLKSLTNLNTNAKVNAAIKEIRGKNPNANWTNVNANGLTNGQKKVLNGLKMGKNYQGIIRSQTAAANNINAGNQQGN